LLPFSFLVVARTVLESYQYFQVGEKLRQVIAHLQAFTTEWGSYIGELDKMGRALNQASQSYERLTQTRTKQLTRRFEKLQLVLRQAHEGQELAEGDVALPVAASSSSFTVGVVGSQDAE
jgi:DNA anti-recombination protein RmuC